MHVLWSAIFGNDRPVEIEVGPGRGDVLLAFAAGRPDVNFFAIEHANGAVERLALRLADAGVTNARVIAADASCVVQHLVPPASVVAYHVYFPDPWPKRRHHYRRIFSPGFAAGVTRTLVPGGVLHVATDLGWLYDDICSVLRVAGFTPAPDVAAPSRPTTRFERKYAKAGTFAGTFAPPAHSCGGPSPSPQKNS